MKNNRYHADIGVTKLSVLIGKLNIESLGRITKILLVNYTLKG